jgi:hypothetical protein
MLGVLVIADVCILRPVVAQKNEVSYQGQNTNRFQMFFSPYARADGFLMDTASGTVRRMVQDSNGDVVFEKVIVEDSPPSGVVSSRYRLFFGPMARADTFLLDTSSGTVWQMLVDPNKNVTFFRKRKLQ